MTMEHRERVQVVNDANYAQERRVVEYAPTTRSVLVARLSRFLWLVTSVIVVMIAFRYFLKLIAANPANAFVDFIYRVTDILVAPFSGIVNSPTFANGSIFDMASLFAVIVYLLLTWLIVSLIRTLFGSVRKTRHITTVEERKN